jgi:hypothetical protein
MPLPTPGKKEGARPGRPQTDSKTDKFTSQLPSWQVQQKSRGRQFLPPDLLLILRRLSSTGQYGGLLIFGPERGGATVNGWYNLGRTR